MSVNKVILVGRTGKDPEITNLRDGMKVARISLATGESYTNKAGEKVEQTEWHNLTFWGGRADVVEKYVAKGHLLYVEGKLHSSTYEKEGKKHYRTEIVVENMRMLGGKPSEPQSKAEPQSEFPAIPPPEDGDDLPF